MHQQPRQILRQLIHHYGATLHSDPRRVEAFLQDICGQHYREIFVLVHAQEQKIPLDLLAAGTMAGNPIHWQRLSRRLQDRLAITAEAADRAVESWALALDVAPKRYRYPRWLRLLWERLSRLNLRRLRLNRAPPSFPQWRSFEKIGVQWGVRLRPWMQNRRWIAATLLALTLLGVVSFSLRGPASGWINTLAFWQSDDTVDAADLDVLSERVSVWLNQTYPLPRLVRIGEESVAVYAEPEIHTTILAYLSPPGALVNVDAYSRDGRWAHVAEPIQGWIDQQQILHLSMVQGDLSDYTVHIDPLLSSTTVDALRVRQTPSLDGAILGELPMGERVLVLAATADGAWLQVVEPMQGWISSEFIVKDAP